MIATPASIPLNTSILCLPDSPFYDVFTLAERAGYRGFHFFNASGRAVLLYLTFQFQGELHGVDVFAGHISGRVVGTYACPGSL